MFVYYGSATVRFHPGTKQRRENWESLTINLNSVFHLTTCFLEDVLSFIDLWNLRNSVRNYLCGAGSCKLWNSACSPQTNILQFILNLSWIQEHAENILSFVQGRRNLQAWNCFSASHPKPTHLTWTHHTFCMCRARAEGAVRTEVLTRPSLLLLGWLK